MTGVIIMKYFNTKIGPTIALLILTAAFSSLGLGQRSLKASAELDTKLNSAQPEASVAPVVFNNANINCANLNASGDVRFSHIVTNFELKLDFSDPQGTFPFTSGSGRSVVGPQDATRTITVNSGSATVSMWSSQIPLTAVIVKVGNTSYVYPYNPSASSDTNLATGDHRGISHLTFCIGEPDGGTTAGDGAIGGRVMNSHGKGISNARLTLVNAATGETSISMTNAFGFYVIDNLGVGEFYILQVGHKRHTFNESSKALTLNDSVTDVDFIANP
jgi:hypothetical protein